MVAGMQTATQPGFSGEQWTIAADGHEAIVVEVGGGIREYASHGVAHLDGYGPHEVCPSSAGQVLAPWPNRIRDGRYPFAGRSHQLGLTEAARRNAMHGLVRWVRWRLVERTAEAVTVEHDLVPQPGYPWPLRLRTTWTVGADGLRAVHEATNVGTQECPFGLATHPYLRLPQVAVDDVELRVPARSQLLTDARNLPVALRRVDGGEHDFSQARRIGAAQLDMTFGELIPDDDGFSRVTLAGGDRRLTVWAGPEFRWWQIFTGDTLGPVRQRRSVAVEPMTCPPDAFRSGRDLVVLAPGQTWRGSWGINPS